MECGKCGGTSESPQSNTEFRVGQRVHAVGDCERIGTVQYIGPVHGYSGTWVGVDWDNGDGKHGGHGYFVAKSDKSGSFVRSHKLSSGISLFSALESRYRSQNPREDEDEMYVLSASNKRVTIQLVGKEKIQEKFSQFQELKSASLCYLGVSSYEPACLNNCFRNLKELDLTGNLLSNWKVVGSICTDIPSLHVLNLSNNKMWHDISELPVLINIQTLVLNWTGIDWMQVEILKQSFPSVEELHLMGNDLCTIMPSSSGFVQGFECLRLLNLEENCFTDWNEIVKLSHLQRLEQLFLSQNKLHSVSYTSDIIRHAIHGRHDSSTGDLTFKSLRCLLLAGNSIEDMGSIDSLNWFPNLRDIRLSDNPIAVPGRGGLPRFVLVARLAKVEVLNGSEVSFRERKESEIRYVRSVMSTTTDNPEERIRVHPRFGELKKLHGIEEERSTRTMTVGLQKLAVGFVSINLKYVGHSICDKLHVTKKLPPTTTVGRLKILCESFFKLGPVKINLFLQEEGSMATLLDDEMATILDIGVTNDSTILVSEV